MAMSHPLREPEPPEELPNYLTDPVERQDVESLEDLQEWIEALIVYKRDVLEEEIEDDDEIPEEAKEGLKEGGPTLVDEMVECGKENCNSCPHGPYTYKYYRKNGKIVSEYVGKAEE